MNDQQVVESIRNNKADKALQELYKYFPVVKKMIVANAGTVNDALDVYQEALIVFYKKAKGTDFTLTSSLNTYLYGVSNYLWKDELKKRKKQHYVSMPALETPVDFDAEIYNEQEKFNKLGEQAILKLGERCQEILRLFYFESWSMQKIAEKFGYNSEKVAKNQKYKCIETARQALLELKKLNAE